MDPFQYVTIASVCMGIYKTLFLKQKMEIEITRDQTPTWYALDNFEGVTGIWLDEKWMALGDLEKEDSTEVGKRRLKSPIAVVPSQGYVSKGNYSKISIQWLEWLMYRSRKRGAPIHIQHALNDGEHHIPGTNYRCDGFAENPNGKGTLYEFYGKILLTDLENFVSNLPLPFPLLREGGGGGKSCANSCFNYRFFPLQNKRLCVPRMSGLLPAGSIRCQTPRHKPDVR